MRDSDSGLRAHSIQAEAPEPSTLRGNALAGVCVLVVEDDEDGREMIVTLLETYGARVLTAASGDEGYCVFERERPAVLVSDLMMPDGDGYSLIHRVRALPEDRGGGAPAIAVSALNIGTRAMREGFTAHFLKPVDPLLLVDAIRTLAWDRVAR